MRVAHVNDIAFVGTAMVRALRASGVDARLVEPLRPGARIPYPWKLATLPLRAAGLLAAGAQLRHGRFDLVHVHYARLGILGPLAGRPYALHCHGSDVRGVLPASAWGREVEPFLRGAALVYYATPDLRPWVEAFRPDAAFLPNPIEPPSPDVRDVTPDRDLLVGVRLSAVKGVDAIVSVVRAVVGARPATTVTILDHGEGVGRVAAAAGRAGTVAVPVPHERMPRLLRSHRVALGQQRVGALGNFELEAMAAGVPVAASFRHVEAYGAPPPLVGGADPEEVASRIVALLDDEPSRQALGAAGVAWVAAHHDPAVVAGRLLADYASVLRDR